MAGMHQAHVRMCVQAAAQQCKHSRHSRQAGSGAGAAGSGIIRRISTSVHTHRYAQHKTAASQRQTAQTATQREQALTGAAGSEPCACSLRAALTSSRSSSPT